MDIDLLFKIYHFVFSGILELILSAIWFCMLEVCLVRREKISEILSPHCQ